MAVIGVKDPTQVRVNGLVDELREAEAALRHSYARVLDVVAQLDAENAGTVAGFGTTARLLAGVLNLSRSEARTRVEQAGQLMPRRSLTGTPLPALLPATAAELAAGRIGPGQVRVITSTMGRIPPSVHPKDVAEAEQTLAESARRFDPAALGRIAERLLAHLDPDGAEPTEEPEQVRELRVHTRSDGTVRLDGRLDAEGGARVLEVLSALNDARSGPDGTPDPRSRARRNADALVDAMSTVLDDGRLPAKGGQRPHLVLTMGLRELTDGIGTGLLDTGAPITAAEARRLACDATVIPMVLGTDSEPLDVGRSQRLAGSALRAALAQRDQGCAYPACYRPPRHCQAHHIRHWLDGGGTCLSK